MNSDLSHIITTIAIYALPVLFSITIHEAAHGYAARRFGDPTAEQLGRITLNPLKHIDPIGTVLMPLFLYIVTAGNFLFGYAKPVPVRQDRLFRPKQDMVWVAFAGPASNFVQALIWGFLAVLFSILRFQEGSFMMQMCQAGVVVNLVMCALNLFPLPPLDGGRIAVGLLPNPLSSLLAQVERYGFFIVIGLTMLRPKPGGPSIFQSIWLDPVMGAIYALMNILLSPLRLFLPA